MVAKDCRSEPPSATVARMTAPRRARAEGQGSLMAARWTTEASLTKVIVVSLPE